MNLMNVRSLKTVVTTIVLFGTLVTLWTGAPAWAQEFVSPWATNLSFGVGADYSTGTYGAGTRTNSVAFPVTVEWRPREWLDFQVGVPYIYQSNSVSPVYVVNPVTAQAESEAVPATTDTKGKTQGSTQNQQQGTSAGTQATATAAVQSAGSTTPGRMSSQNGIGDLSLQVGVTFLQEGDILPQFRALLYLKCPTGDRENWLGSGEFDEGIGLALSKSLGNLSLYLEGMWIFQGGSTFLVESGYTARDYLSYYAEVGYQATDSLIPAVAFRGTTPASDELGGSAEIRLKLAWKATEHFSVQAYAGTGLTTASSDFSSGASLFYNF